MSKQRVWQKPRCLTTPIWEDTGLPHPCRAACGARLREGTLGGGVLTIGEGFGCRSKAVPGLQSGPAPVVSEDPAVVAATALPSGASSSCSRLSCRGELPRDSKSGGEALPVGPEADGREAGVAARDAGGPHSARGHVHGCLGDEVRPGSSGWEAGIILGRKLGWPGKKAWGRPGVTVGKE